MGIKARANQNIEANAIGFFFMSRVNQVATEFAGPERRSAQLRLPVDWCVKQVLPMLLLPEKSACCTLPGNHAREVFLRDMGDFMRHYPGQFRFALGCYDEAGVEPHEAAGQRERIDSVIFHREELEFLIWMSFAGPKNQLVSQIGEITGNFGVIKVTGSARISDMILNPNSRSWRGEIVARDASPRSGSSTARTLFAISADKTAMPWRISCR